ncbi:MAG: hypothetical protein NC244_11530 [Alistipes senegalensis]|nr:hypothetical protein [Alistipes senegalensis]
MNELEALIRKYNEGISEINKRYGRVSCEEDYEVEVCEEECVVCEEDCEIEVCEEVVVCEEDNIIRKVCIGDCEVCEEDCEMNEHKRNLGEIEIVTTTEDGFTLVTPITLKDECNNIVDSITKALNNICISNNKNNGNVDNFIKKNYNSLRNSIDRLECLYGFIDEILFHKYDNELLDTTKQIQQQSKHKLEEIVKKQSEQMKQQNELIKQLQAYCADLTDRCNELTGKLQNLQVKDKETIGVG